MIDLSRFCIEAKPSAGPDGKGLYAKEAVPAQLEQLNVCARSISTEVSTAPLG